MITYIKGDLLASDADFICHGVNCVGGFGSGVAGQIAKKFPHVKHAYLQKFGSDGWELGEVQFVKINYRSDRPQTNAMQYIVNCATQQEYYPRDRVHADYEAIEKCMNIVKQFATEKQTIALPLIGCGLAGGSWNIVEKILNKVFANREIWVYTL